MMLMSSLRNIATRMDAEVSIAAEVVERGLSNRVRNPDKYVAKLVEGIGKDRDAEAKWEEDPVEKEELVENGPEKEEAEEEWPEKEEAEEDEAKEEWQEKEEAEDEWPEEEEPWHGDEGWGYGDGWHDEDDG